MDNLSHVYVQKYVKKDDEGYSSAVTDLDFLVDENCKYSNFLGDLIVQLESIEQISHEKIGKISNLFLGGLKFQDKKHITYLTKELMNI